MHKQIQNILHRILGFHSIQRTAHNINCFLLFLIQQKILSSGTGFRNVDGRKDTAFRKLPIQHKLHISGSFKFLINDIIHLTSGINQCRRKNRQAAALPHIARCAEKPLRHV